MINIRKLTAIEIAFLGPVFVLAEYACTVLLSVALGIFVLFRAQSHSHVALRIYLVCLAINYAAMLGWATAIVNKENARAELGRELTDQRHALSKYRRQSLFLLVPLLPLGLMATQRRKSGR